MSRLGVLGAQLYRGEVSYDFVGRQKRWYLFSAGLLIISIAALLVRGLTLGIEFKGGSEFSTPTGQCTVASARDAVARTGLGGEPIVQQVGADRIRVEVGQLSPDEGGRVKAALAEECGVAVDDVSSSFVGPSWGADVSNKALRALVVFLGLVVLFLTVYFEWKMAIAALVALVHDLLITIGVYSLVGFEVTPATVIGVLTILGYSLYDTVVVFDKVKENTTGIQGGSRMTYSGAANLAVNQTLVRSINTSVIALLPVAAILFVGAGLLGAGTLKDLSLALFVGIAAGAYSSIFIATPLLADLKEREPGMQALAKRVAARQAGVASPRAASRARAAARPAAVPSPPAEVDGSGDARTCVHEVAGEPGDGRTPAPTRVVPRGSSGRSTRKASAGKRAARRRR